jgi:hypothetical protein
MRDLATSEKIKIKEYYAGVSGWHVIGLFVVVERN